MSSFDLGAIFQCRLDQKLAIDGIVVSIASFGKNLYCDIGFDHDAPFSRIVRSLDVFRYICDFAILVVLHTDHKR